MASNPALQTQPDFKVEFSEPNSNEKSVLNSRKSANPSSTSQQMH
jgi:hypothetical protein